MEHCKLIPFLSANAKTQMDLDLELLEKEWSNPVLRFYEWKPRAVSLGKFQKYEEVLNLDYCRRKGIDWIYRPTGGGAIYHYQDISYSLLVPKSILQRKQLNVKESYRFLTAFLLQFFKELGLDVNYAIDFNFNHQKTSQKSVLCYHSHEPYDIVCKGYKLGGNAQYWSKRLVLQQGTIPISVADENEMFKTPMENHTLGLSQLGIEIIKTDIIQQLIKTFEIHYQTKVVEINLESELSLTGF